MLDMGFIPDVKRIVALLTARKQNLLFSATLTDEIRTLAKSFLRDPIAVQVAPKHATADLVSHVVHPVTRERKRELLVHLVKSRSIDQVLVFVATRIGANRLAYQLNREGVHATAIHGDRSQAERMQALEDFKAGKVGVLVATDVAARGLDIEELPHVVNFDLPNSPDDYVHRIGHTGRAGTAGTAISLVCPEEQERGGDREDDPHPDPARGGDRVRPPLGSAADGAAAPGASPGRGPRPPHAFPQAGAARQAGAAGGKSRHTAQRSRRMAPTRSSAGPTSPARRNRLPPPPPSPPPGRRSANARSPRCSAASCASRADRRDRGLPGPGRARRARRSVRRRPPGTPR